MSQPAAGTTRTAITTLAALPATMLIGEYVYHRSGAELGHIRDVVLDVEQGRIAYAILSIDGGSGMPDRLVAVPWRALEPRADASSFVLDIDRRRLSAASSLTRESWPDMSDPDWGERTHEFYGVAPYWDQVRQRDVRLSSRNLGKAACWRPLSESGGLDLSRVRRVMAEHEFAGLY